MTSLTSQWQHTGRVQKISSMLVLLGMMAVIGSALAFEHIGGYAPCALCLEQRVPYYWGIPIAGLALIAATQSLPTMIVRLLLLAVAVCLVITAGLGVYHSGVEWGFFEAPQTCGAAFSASDSDASSLLHSLANAKPPSCADAAGRFLGLSFAGWNVVAAVILTAIALRGAFGKAD